MLSTIDTFLFYSNNLYMVYLGYDTCPRGDEYDSGAVCSFSQLFVRERESSTIQNRTGSIRAGWYWWSGATPSTRSWSVFTGFRPRQSFVLICATDTLVQSDYHVFIGMLCWAFSWILSECCFPPPCKRHTDSWRPPDLMLRPPPHILKNMCSLCLPFLHVAMCFRGGSPQHLGHGLSLSLLSTRFSLSVTSDC